MTTLGGRHLLLKAAVAVAAALLCSSLVAWPAAAAHEDIVHHRPRHERPLWVAGELLLRFAPGLRPVDRSAARARLDATRIRTVGDGGWELVRTADPTSPAPDEARRAQADPAVTAAQPNFLYYPAATVPDDADFSRLWGLHNTGQTGGTPDADIDAPEAWAVAADQSDLVVAVTDTGVWTDHPDLAANIWTNPGEVAGNDVDDDGNGYPDDVHGWDFHHRDGSVFDETDPDDHGTHVAGTIAAVANNASHVAGVSNAKIMALKFLGRHGGATTDGIEAINYAVDNGADVINASWGGGLPDAALEAAIAAAGEAGILFVAAAGNGGEDGIGDDNDSTPGYPASYDLPNIISVAATTHTDGLATFSNYGATSVDLGAPGQSILSTVPQFGKTVLTGPDTPGAVSYHSAYHSFGLEGVPASGDRQALLDAALDWIGATTTTPILVVDDDNGDAFQSAYTGALTALGHGANVATHTVATGGSCGSKSGPEAATMLGKVVIWLTGDDFGCWGPSGPTGDSTLTSTDQLNLTAHLTSGGALLLFGQDVGFDLTDNGTVDNTFLSSELKTGYIADLDLNFRLLGQPATAYAGLPTIELDVTQVFSSALLALPDAEAGLRGSPTTWFSGTSMATPHVAGAAAVVHASFPTLSHIEVKARLLELGDPIAALDGKTVSGNRLNLHGALDAPAPPAAPTGVSATAGNASSVVVWTPPADDGGSAVTGYTITTYKSGTKAGTTSAGATATSKTVTGLTNGASYTFTVKATNAAGTGIESAVSNSVTPKTVPAAPSSVVATAGHESATVTWKAPSSGGSAITSYTVTTHTGGSAVKSTKMSASTTTATVTGLKPGAAYTFTVKATNAVGTGPSSSPSNSVTIPLPRSGYWMLGSSGNVQAFGDAAHFGNATLPAAAEDIEPSPSGNGYWVVDAAGFVGTFGDAPYHGGLNGALQPGEVVTALSATPSGDGYWLFTNLGRVATFGAAPHLDDMAGVALNGPVLDSVATPSGKGYYMVGSDGGIFAFGDAAFYGSMGGVALNAPVQSLVPDGDGIGYWLVASDGGIFAFEAAFYGSMGATPLNQPITGMVASGSAGYLMVASDGGIFAFGSAPFHGSLGASPPPYPIVAVAVLRD